MNSRAEQPSDLLAGARYSPIGGDPLVFVDFARDIPRPQDDAIRVAIDRRGALPDIDPSAFDLALTTAPDAPAPWTWVVPGRVDDAIAHIREVCGNAPIAATMLARALRLGDILSFDAALEVESLAYSTLLAGAEFAAWRNAHPPVAAEDGPAEGRVVYVRDGDQVTLSLAAPSNRNAMTAAMRDALYEALVNVLEDPSLPTVVLEGQGRCFSTGGHLPEFGVARDVAAAHIIRFERSCARILHLLGDRATARLHGACIGSGIEVPAAAGRRIATPTTFVKLPELTMGLIPGAGGTVTLPRAIGRHRTMWLALTGQRLNARQGLEWGLYHAVEP